MKKFLLLLILLLVAPVVAGTFYPREAASIALQVERARNGLGHETRKVDGEIWHYLAGGPADAQAVVMVHGFGADKDNWIRFAGHLADRYRLIVPDLPGFGDSARHPGWDYTLPQQVERLHGFLTALGIGRLHMVGNSMGGHITALYAHTYPDQVLSIGLFNNAGIAPRVENEMTLAVKRGDNPLLAQSVEDYDRLIRFVMEKEPFIPGFIRRAKAEAALQHRDFNAYIYSQYKADRESGLEPLLAEMRTPALILWGRQDRAIDVSVVDIMRPLMPHAEVSIFEDTGHLPMIERPKQSADRYLAFISSHDERTP